ncbi:MAG TPA: MFS transporter [Rhizobiaceae bacterium]|nr:MFS transporter [Rhizobiaceae bacterium]
MDKRLIWLGVGAFSTSTVAFVFSGLLPLIAADTGISVSGAGHLITAYSLAYAIGTPVLSAVAGAVDRRRLIAAALLAFLAGNALAGISVSFGMLLAAQIVMGMAAGLFAATAQATAVSLAGPEHRARAVATVMGGTTFAVALGAPLAALIANIAGWRSAFLVVAVLALICLTVLWLALPRGLAGTRLTLNERLTAIGRPGIFASLLVTFLYMTGGFMVISYLAPLAIEGAGLAVAVMPGMLLAFGIGAICGNAISGRLSDRIGPSRVAALALASSSLMCLAIALDVEFLPHTIAGPLLIALMVPWGIVGWTFPPAQASRIVGQAPDVTHLTLSLNVSALYFGIALGTFIGGGILEVASPVALALAAAPLPLIALAILVASGRRLRTVPAAG